MFFLDDQLNRRRVSDIKCVSSGRLEIKPEGQRWVHDIEMSDGTQIVVRDVTWQQIQKTPAMIWPSEPGLSIWSPDLDGSGDYIEPVVGWAVTVGGSVIPLKSGGEFNEVDYDAIVISTDGSVWQNGFRRAASLEAYKSSPRSE